MSWREQVNCQWDDDEVRFVLNQHFQFGCSSLKLYKLCKVLRHKYKDYYSPMDLAFDLILHIHIKHNVLEETSR